ncbi:MAG: hypothetical protein N0C81_15625 [Candidatus Thiodiazotropha lotti]|uniref:Uncharacterized protein n=1 Tax=Candidatus Thiodiazotropha lotti TaxID=2792787 RepID=A0A9E4K2B9_9GAMM|nr:hypothetical protein [Candidatus Thiodiazotropha lotti]MCG7937454.1 hypothetical protein [Candidatus Thiodiazotropha lotti]MCG8003995.1 hypothetical protein [Candidatus Thiodiazotropha lotti]MCG8009055.1 hypothetical protein [Candidatus Thiodiazotropha lotti]MCW4187616.1 hypothetical protein [Candidatus Thiodiazotropha lotti]
MRSIDNIREYRKTIYSIAEFLISNENAVSEFSTVLEWSDLEYIPTWLLWDKNDINNLILTAGTIFLLPSIRIWIDGKKIQEVRELIGKELFDLIMETTKIDNNQTKTLDLDHIEESLLSAGSAVIVSSSNMRIRPWITNVIPKPKGKLDFELANEIMKHTIFVINQNQFKKSMV